MIGILIPTRGMIFTRVIRAIEEMKSCEWMEMKYFFSEGLPIPDSHNSLVERALKEGITHLLFIEEDVIPPKDSLKKMFYATEDISFVDYPVNGWSCVTRDKKDHILWAGLGCTMIKRQVFEKLEKPWFRTDKVLRLNDMEWVDANQSQTYGGQDIWFFTKAREAGFTIKQIEGECKHLRLDAIAKKGTNDGVHRIGVRERIKNYNIL